MLEEIVAGGGTRVVIVSGRPADELPPLLELAQQPEIWGSHGWERLLPDGTARRARAAARGARRAGESGAGRCGTSCLQEHALERQARELALHWRGLADTAAAELEHRGARVLGAERTRAGALELLPFDGGLELRAVGCNKQYAVKAVLAETAKDSAVAYLGDDITDEDAFRAVKTRGVGVLVRPEFRETEADVWLQPPQRARRVHAALARRCMTRDAARGVCRFTGRV